MPYSINTYSLGRTFTVEDGTIDSNLDIKLIGKNYAGYGEVQNENFVYLLENFAGANAPPRPISGQLWYDTSVKKLKFYDTNTARWKSAGGAEVNSTQPAGLATGDFWYDTVNKQVYVYDGTNFVLVGPQGVAGLGTTQMKSIIVTDNGGAPHAVIAAYVDGEIIYIVSSSEEFTLGTASQTELGGTAKFGIIKKGITLASTNNSDGVTDVASNKIFWGTVSNATMLDGHQLGDFILKTGGEVSFDSLVRFKDFGFTVGDQNDLVIKIDTDGSTPIIKNDLSDTIKFQTTSSGPVINTPIKLVGADVLPGLANVTDLGSPSLFFSGVYANNFYGTADNADGLKVSTGVYRTGAVAATINTVAVRDSAGALTASSFIGNATSATTATTATNSDNLKVGTSGYFSAAVDVANSGTPNTIVARDVDGNINAVYFQGTATSALFADLAEKYLADAEYETGTVVVVGGEQEVTACQLGDRAFGAVSANPAFMMNEGLVGGTYIALKGRVPVKVIGKVKKGDKLVAAGNGCAGVADVILRNVPIKASGFPDTFAIALENNDDEGVKLVEAIIL